MVCVGVQSNRRFFVSMFFFVLPVFMDCVKFTPLKKSRRLIKMAEVSLTGVLFFISMPGIFNICTLSQETGKWQINATNFVIDLPSGIDVGWIWKLLVFIVIVTFVDWLCNDTKIKDMINTQ